ncbi:hypothetical protein FOCC_FOCC006146 [Frankliniella occidentalis]|nr:hypothetical protein FOCC_FOCC006146 [Frankliniella occidentalis]
MDSEQDVKARVLYLLRAGLSHSAQTLALEGVRRYPTDNVFRMYNGWTLALGSRPQEAIRELDSLSGDRDISLGVIVSLLHVHKLCTTVDNEAVSSLDTRLKDERRSASELSLYHAAYFFCLVGKAERAREYADRLLKSSPQSCWGLTVRGWIELTLIRDGKGDKPVEARAKTAADYFSRALDQNKTHTDAAFGGVRAREYMGDHAGAMSVLNQMIVRFPSATPPLVEKMRNQLAQRDWGQASDSAARALAIDTNSLDALQVNALVLVCRDGDYEGGAEAVQRLADAMEKIEPKNTHLFLENAQLFSRVCGRNPVVLAETLRLAERAAKAEPGGAAAARSATTQELGQQCLLAGRLRDAARHYRTATRADESSVGALVGLTATLLADDGATVPSAAAGDREQARQQVEFLQEVQGDRPSADVLLMAARLSAGDSERALRLLDGAVEAHLKLLQGEPFGPAYLRVLNPDMLLQVAREYQRHAPDIASPLALPDDVGVIAPPTPTALKQCMAVLELVREACPGLLPAHLSLARTQLMAGDVRAAQNTLRHVLDTVDPTSADGHLLLAQALLSARRFFFRFRVAVCPYLLLTTVISAHRQGNTAAAAQSLEVAVSYSFAVRERPLFHLLTALVQRARGDLDESFKSLTAAQALSGLRPGSGGGSGGGAHALSRSEQATLLLELAALQQQQGRWPEAMLALHDAAERFRDTAEEGRVALAHADVLLARGEPADPSAALSVLASVRPSQPYYLQARRRMAHIHLRIRKDRRAYAEVFRQLSPPNRNPGLACKTGRALVQTHQYGKALNYYREAVRGDGDPQLRLDMALLCLKLGQLDKADATLSQELARESSANDAEALGVRVRMQELQARVRERAGGGAVGTVTGVQAALACLQEARVTQARVLKLVAAREGEDSPAVAEQRAVGARLCRQMALHAASLRDNTAAVRYYREALVLQAGSAGTDSEAPPTAETSDTLIALAKLYMQVGDLEQCQATCQTLLRAVPEHDAATVMMADLAFRRVDLEGAWQHFSALLQRRPAYWTALARLVEVSRRRGQLASCVPFLDAAEAQGAAQRAQPGLSYCRGLYSWYSGNASQALHQFNAARRDPEWGQQAVHNMIEICLDGQNLGAEDAGGAEDRDARQAALATAERLLAELRGAAGGPEEEMSKRLLANQLLLAAGDKRGVERAVQDLTAAVSSETESHREPVGAVLGLAQALLLQKQTQRARNQLKRLARTVWTVEQANHLEKAWLLLAELYIQQGKQELAAELLRRVLQHNQGCTRAYESLGVMAEKEQTYREAAGHYERAWRLGAGTSEAGGAARSQPALGYKLAFQYMKCKQYADAIDVCQQVLSAHPNYPRIRKDILEKSRNHLRT